MHNPNYTFKYLLAFGSNKGYRTENLNTSLRLLQKHVFIVQQSLWRKTEPLQHPKFDTSDHEYYINFVCEVETVYAPLKLYKIITKIEDTIGHPRHRRWCPRELDIDILFCAKKTNSQFSLCEPFAFQKQPDFFVPHIEYYNRDFWRQMVEQDLCISKDFLAKHFL